MDASFYSSRTWRRVRRAALRRDGHRCQAVTVYGAVRVHCHTSRDLDVHHVKRPEDGGEMYALSNLLTLCGSCHQRLHLTDPGLRAKRRRPRPKIRQRPNAAAYRKYDPSEVDPALSLANPDLADVA